MSTPTNLVCFRDDFSEELVNIVFVTEGESRIAADTGREFVMIARASDSEQVRLAWVTDLRPAVPMAKEFADKALALISEDVANEIVAPDVDGFSALHSYVDANEYIIQVGVILGVDEDGFTDYSFASLVEDIIDSEIKLGVLRAAMKKA